jgi:archaellum component FlaC
MKDEDKTYENEVRINSYPRDNKKVNDKIYSLKADIDRIQEEYDNFKIVSAGHQKINGELRIEIKELKARIKQLEDPLNGLRKDGDI